ncbi:MAG: hypothetical protein M3Y21_05040 [Candidatus Eremiobacteraeota bacterium]|nr:hypothetical protein [Candidatus Eremiobacteraeota bacterium]
MIRKGNVYSIGGLAILATQANLNCATMLERVTYYLPQTVRQSIHQFAFFATRKEARDSDRLPFYYIAKISGGNFIGLALQFLRGYASYSNIVLAVWWLTSYTRVQRIEFREKAYVRGVRMAGRIGHIK